MENLPIRLGLTIELDGGVVTVKVDGTDVATIAGATNPRDQIRNLGHLLAERHGCPFWDKPVYMLTEEEARSVYHEMSW
ncbi:hypothetical protein H6784_05510 [Candidatus Nomurabacteria bacterium]|nr:hypothetical protein [Candidatus Kaiserbacteria bacterium]MCB9814836.1 hypothetical protein [Candidatus Nomurabacteria bacterium]